eukprot:scaffold5415_cov92-Isochrysis_galbana.AAC.2
MPAQPPLDTAAHPSWLTACPIALPPAGAEFGGPRRATAAARAPDPAGMLDVGRTWPDSPRRVGAWSRKNGADASTCAVASGSPAMSACARATRLASSGSSRDMAASSASTVDRLRSSAEILTLAGARRAAAGLRSRAGTAKSASVECLSWTRIAAISESEGKLAGGGAGLSPLAPRLGCAGGRGFEAATLPRPAAPRGMLAAVDDKPSVHEERPSIGGRSLNSASGSTDSIRAALAASCANSAMPSASAIPCAAALDEVAHLEVAGLPRRVEADDNVDELGLDGARGAPSAGRGEVALVGGRGLWEVRGT